VSRRLFTRADGSRTNPPERPRASRSHAAVAFSRGQVWSQIAAYNRVNERKTPSLKQIGCAALVLIGLAVSVPRTAASAGIPEGVWLIDNKVAVQIFDCSNLLCGRILWLSIPRDPQSRLDRDKKNPQPALRQRPLCGLTILWGLRPAGPDRWTDGWFYNPDDGDTYIPQRNSDPPTRSKHASIWASPSLGRPKLYTACHTAHRTDGAE
jgi:uncharacterized protein (DUF2147 family)